MEIEDAKVKHLAKMFIAFLSSAALHGVQHLPERVLYPISKWLLGGAIALSFAMLTNRKDFVCTYGLFDTKFVMGLLLASILCGAVYSIGEYIQFAVKSNALANTLALKLGDELYGKGDNSGPTLDSIANDNWKYSIESLKMILKNTKSFWLQVVTLLSALCLLLRTFFILS